MRGPARGVAAVAVALAALAGAAHAADDRGLSALDRGEVLEDEPLWFCAGAGPDSLVLEGANLRLVAAPGVASDTRAYEFSDWFGYLDPSGRMPIAGTSNGPPAGDYVLHPAGHGKPIARFRVVAPKGSERYVRDALARAARLDRVLGQPAQAEALYEAVLQRYPRTSYLSAVYLGLWRVREGGRFGREPDRWIEDVFARFHDSCFGVAALDLWVADMGRERAAPTLRRLVGIYPSTRISAAARSYL